jgi:spermidine/putrescine transport system permease protein
MRAGRWVRRNLVMMFALLVLLYLFAPIMVVMLMSFNAPKSKLPRPQSRWFLPWWCLFCHRSSS